MLQQESILFHDIKAMYLIREQISSSFMQFISMKDELLNLLAGQRRENRGYNNVYVLLDNQIRLSSSPNDQQFLSWIRSSSLLYR